MSKASKGDELDALAPDAGSGTKSIKGSSKGSLGFMGEQQTPFRVGSVVMGPFSITTRFGLTPYAIGPNYGIITMMPTYTQYTPTYTLYTVYTVWVVVSYA